MDVFLKADCSQVELRWAGINSMDETFIRAYTEGRDVHQETLDMMKRMRRGGDRTKAKIINFRMLYLSTPYGLAMELKIPQEEAEGLVAVHKKTYPGYWKWVSYIQSLVESGKEIVTWWGRKRKFKPDDIGNAVNFPTQSGANDYMLIWVIPKLSRTIYRAYLRLTTHDDMIFSIPVLEIPSLISQLETIQKVFNNYVPIPMKFDYSVGENWRDMIKINDLTKVHEDSIISLLESKGGKKT